MKKTLEPLQAEKFKPLDCSAINHIKGGEDTCTGGYNYTLNGVTKTAASDCFRLEADGRFHTYFYDKDGKVMDEKVQ